MIDYQNSGYLQDPDSMYRRRLPTEAEPSRTGAGNHSAADRGTRPAADRGTRPDADWPAEPGATAGEERSGQEMRRNPADRASEPRVTDLSPIEHLAHYLGTTTEAVLENVPNAVLQALCRIPQHSRLRRYHDSTLIGRLRTLVDAMPADDLRRPRLRFLLEEAERRSRM
jgi:hypothetical protein